MKLKHIAIASLALVAGTSFAANVNVNNPALGAANQGTGLMFMVTNTTNGTSYDLDMGVTFKGFEAQMADAAYTQSWALDSNWTSFYNAANSADYVWSVIGGFSNGGTSVVGNNGIMTTVNSAFDTSVIPSQGAGQIAATVSNINFAGIDINSKAVGDSYVASAVAQDPSYFGGDNGGKVTYTLNNYIAPGFTTYNAIGGASVLLDLGNTGTRTGGKYTMAESVGTFSFDGTALTYAATPAVPEPSTYGLALVGLLLAGMSARRTAKK